MSLGVAVKVTESPAQKVSLVIEGAAGAAVTRIVSEALPPQLLVYIIVCEPSPAVKGLKE